jgi:hypothetical protein
METLSFGFYSAIHQEFELYIDILYQLKRDYEREKREQFIIAIDFSELYGFIHAKSIDAQRVSINTYILNKLNDQFTILPGSFYELLNDIENIAKTINKPGISSLIKNYKTVNDFFTKFPQAIQSYENAIQLYRNQYRNAEKDVELAINFLLNELVPNYSSVQAIQDLIKSKKIMPINSIEQINDLTPSAKEKYRNIYQLVESDLYLRRPNILINNQIDAIDSIITMLLNFESKSNNRYITIYSQTIPLLRVLRSHEELKWDNDYLVRDAQYLKFRTNLQNMFDTLEKRLEYVEKWTKKCEMLKLEVNKLIDVDKHLQKNSGIVPSLKLIDLYRQFDEDCRQPLIYMESSSKQKIIREEITNLYKILREQGMYEGKEEHSYEILKEHFRNILKELNAFNSFLIDSTDVSIFKNNIKKWLDVEF